MFFDFLIPINEIIQTSHPSESSLIHLHQKVSQRHHTDMHTFVTNKKDENVSNQANL